MEGHPNAPQKNGPATDQPEQHPGRKAPRFTQAKTPASVRIPVYRSPHKAKSISGSTSKVIKGLAARIALHCEPSHNWESRRKDLQESVSVMLLAPVCHASQGSTLLGSLLL
jgi:hypothetical protein